MIRVAINGFGRIGKNFLRGWLEDSQAQKQIQIVAINIGFGDVAAVAHVFKYDTLLGTYAGTVVMDGSIVCIDDHRIAVYAESDPTKLPWKSENIDWVVEATGRFTTKAGASGHSVAGAKKVLISAPSVDADCTIILGVNDHEYAGQSVVSLGSCTTNAVAPLLHIIDQHFGIVSAYMSTIHSYTNDQVLLDLSKSDPRRGRAAGLNIVPTTTGAMKVVGVVLPHLKNKLGGCSLRVPVAKVSLIDLSYITREPITVDVVHSVIEKMAQTTMKHIISLTHEPLVSSDFSKNDHSVIVDGLMTETVGSMGKLFGWYDNEWAYSVRLKDFLMRFGAQ